MIKNVELRLAKRAEATQIANLSRNIIEHGLHWSWTPSRVLSSFDCPDTVVLSACLEDRVVGFAIMHFKEYEARLNLFGVDCAYRRLGVGRRLVEWLEKSALVAGISVVYLEVREANAGAVAFYRKLGYREIQRLPGYYQTLESGVRMARDLWCSDSSKAI